MTRGFVLLAGMIAASLTSCTSVTGGQSSSAELKGTSAAPLSSATTTSTVSHPPPNKNNNGTSFDPCGAYGGEELRAVGLDPATGKSIESSLLRGCKWNGQGWRVQVGVLNGSIDRYLNHDLFEGSVPITIDGLNGVTYRDTPGDMRGCYVELPSEKATVGTILTVSDEPALTQIPDACTKAVEIATLTAKKLPR